MESTESYFYGQQGCAKWTKIALLNYMRLGAGRLIKFSAKNPVVLELERIFEAKLTTRSLRWRYQTRLFFVAGLCSDEFSLSRPQESVSRCKRLGAALWKLSYD